MSRDTIIRDTAYAIWEAEGRPEGRSHDHWLMAEQQVARTTKGEAAPKADGTTPNKPAAKRAPVKKAAGKAPVSKAH